MRKIFLSVFMIFILTAATAFAEEETSTTATTAETAQTEETSAGYEYTSATFGFKMVCPAEPKVVVNPFPDPKRRGELLIFAVTADGQDVAYGYQIEFEAFDNKITPDFNKASKKTINNYLEKLKKNGAYEEASIANISKDNKGVFALTAREIEILDEKGEVEGVATAKDQYGMVFFRTKSGRCIAIELITKNMNREAADNFIKSVSTYQDATDLSMADNSKGKKSKK